MGVLEPGQLPAVLRTGVAHEIVGRLKRRLVLGEDAAAVVVEHGHHGLVAPRSGLEEAFALAGGEIHAVEEGMVAGIRGARARQEDPVPVLYDERLAVLRAPRHRGPGIAVAVLRVAFPDQPGLVAAVHVDLPGAHHVGPSPRLGQKCETVLPPRESRVAEGRARHLRGVTVERRGQPHHLVALLRLRPGIAPVERLDPHQGVVLAGHPAVSARAFLHASDGGSVRERDRRDFGHHAAVPAPDLELLREARIGHQVGEGAHRPLREDVRAAGRTAEIPDAGLPQRAHRPVVRIHDGGLGGGEVLVQRCAVGVFDEVLVGAHRGGSSFGFLDDRTAGNRGRHGRGPASRGHQGAEQLVPVGHPVARCSAHAVQPLVGESADSGLRDASCPELDPVAHGARDREPVTCGSKAWHAPTALRRVDGSLGTIGDIHHGEGGGQSRIASRGGSENPGGRRIDAPATQAKHGLRHVLDRGHAATPREHDPLPVRADVHERGRRRVQDAHDLLGRHAIALLGGGVVRGRAQKRGGAGRHERGRQQSPSSAGESSGRGHGAGGCGGRGHDGLSRITWHARHAGVRTAQTRNVGAPEAREQMPDSLAREFRLR